MRILLPLVAVLLVAAPGSVHAADATSESGPNEPQKLAPYEVAEAPFGYLGIKHASARFDLLRFVTFRGGLAYVQVDEFFPDSPAIRAGIKQGDWIVGVNGKPIGKWSFSQLRRFSETLEVGQHVLVDIYRPSDGSEIHADVVVVRRPKPPTR